MENNNVVLLKHHPLFNLKKDNPFYTNQLPDICDFHFFDVTSRSLKDKEFTALYPDFAHELSPFFIGPVVSGDGVVCHIFEHFWQASKVYPCHLKEGNVTPEYFTWRDSWFRKEKSDKLTRHPNAELGFEPSDCQFMLAFDKATGKWLRLGYVEARKKIYIPEYARLVVKTKSYQMLKDLVDKGEKVALVDFDGYNYYNHSYKEGLYKDIHTMKDVINSSRFKCGHGFVLKLLLEGDIEVTPDGTVIDHAGVLD